MWLCWPLRGAQNGGCPNFAVDDKPLGSEIKLGNGSGKPAAQGAGQNAGKSKPTGSVIFPDWKAIENKKATGWSPFYRLCCLSNLIKTKMLFGITA